MAYKFNDSEKFRANIYLLAGFGCSTPIGISLNEYIIHENIPSIIDSIIISLLFVLSLLAITYSYSIIYVKDELNA